MENYTAVVLVVKDGAAVTGSTYYVSTGHPGSRNPASHRWRGRDSATLTCEGETLDGDANAPTKGVDMTAAAASGIRPLMCTHSTRFHTVSVFADVFLHAARTATKTVSALANAVLAARSAFEAWNWLHSVWLLW